MIYNLELHEESPCCDPTSHVECSIVKTQSIGGSSPIVKNYNHRMRRKVLWAIKILLVVILFCVAAGSSLIFATQFLEKPSEKMRGKRAGGEIEVGISLEGLGPTMR